MGGDRDGNPFVTATCTRDVVYLARITAVNLYFKAIQDLIFSLSMWRCTDKFRERARVLHERETADHVYGEYCPSSPILILKYPITNRKH